MQLPMQERHRRPGFSPWVGKLPWRRAGQPHSSILARRIPWTKNFVLGLPWWLRWQRLPAVLGDLDSDPGLGSSLGDGNGYSLQYSCLENSVDRAAWRATVCGSQRVKNQTQLSDYNCHLLMIDLQCSIGLKAISWWSQIKRLSSIYNL